ncbi:MAG TPA: transposase [Candidatus Nitrosocosmicus sp.]
MSKYTVDELFRYLNNFLLLLLDYAKAYFHLSCRQTDGIIQRHVKGKLLSITDFTTIKRRINKLDIPINTDKDKVSRDEYIVVAMDSTDIKVTNRDQWMQDKWNLYSRL